jgi:hypothetical protein
MKRLLIILFTLILLTAIGLYLRPSYVLIGQLDWVNVITKGYFVGSIQRFFSQGMIDESFYYVMKFSVAGFVLGIILAILFGGKTKKRRSKD